VVGIAERKLRCSNFVEPGLVRFGKILLSELASRLSADFPRPLLEEKSALGLDASHQRVKDQNRAAEVDLVGMVCPSIPHMKDHRRLLAADFPSQGHHLLSGNTRLPFRPLRRVGTDELIEL